MRSSATPTSVSFYAGPGKTYDGVLGEASSAPITASGDYYYFGVHGSYSDSSSSYSGLMSGGVLGSGQAHSGLKSWAALGYETSGGTWYATYYDGTASGASGGGYLPDAAITGIGSGGCGGIIGSWTKGEVMGQVSAGELFASYNLGNAYTSGYSAEVVTLDDKRVAAYTLTSTDIKVYNDGTGTLTNGRASVNFDENFSELIGENIPVVTVTPMGQCNGVYITNVTSKGFDIIELNNGNSNVEFSYIVVGKRIDAGGKPELPDALKKKDFDENMKGVMHNENNTEQSGKPVWWDGTQIRFDAPPSDKTNKQEDKK